MRLLLLPVLFLMAAAFAALGQPMPVLPDVKLPPQAREVSTDEAQRFITEHVGTGILDVRTAEEVKGLGRLPGAGHVDYFRDDFGVQVVKLGLDPAKPCLVYCALGGRAQRAAQALAAVGFKEILVLKDGFNAWKKAGKPVEGGETAKQ